jgi:ABC-type polysaccharide/polyol phosphate transport system ATPase subunit
MSLSDQAPLVQPVTGSPAAADAIVARNLGVQYDLRFNRKRPMREAFARVITRKPPERFWALRHVSLRLAHGESLGIIGPNGAGKSTLLQVLAGIMRPTEGSVETRGAISGLLGLGVGFDNDLSGRDNILLGGAFLGLDDKLTRELMPSVIEFADLGQFIDAPLKTYSQGMRARLGFSIATVVNPDILLLDEVLATGDTNFREKSKARVIELVKAAKAVVLVTHDTGWVEEYCNRAMLLEHGTIILEGSPADVVRTHVERTEAAKAARAAAARAAGLDPAVAR